MSDATSSKESVDVQETIPIVNQSLEDGIEQITLDEVSWSCWLFASIFSISKLFGLECIYRLAFSFVHL